MIFLTADEHYNHANIIKYCNRPFTSVEEMNAALIARHNEVVKDGDTVYHLGDFAFGQKEIVMPIIKQLNGKHIFIQGSHDRWLNGNAPSIIEFRHGNDVWVGCHYAMRVWPKSHYGAYQAYGHSHGHLPPTGRQMDVGVDTHNFYPYSLDEVKKLIDDTLLSGDVRIG